MVVNNEKRIPLAVFSACGGSRKRHLHCCRSGIHAELFLLHRSEVSYVTKKAPVHLVIIYEIGQEPKASAVPPKFILANALYRVLTYTVCCNVQSRLTYSQGFSSPSRVHSLSFPSLQSQHLQLSVHVPDRYSSRSLVCYSSCWC